MALRLVISLCLCAAAACAQPQLGLRLDPLNSMQWNGSQLFLHGDQATSLKLSVKSLYEIWPGPVAGSFSVYSSEGVGMLLGRDVVASATLFDANAILRSAIPSSVVGLVPLPGSSESEFYEYRGRNGARLLFKATQPIVDFDVTATNAIVYLPKQGPIFVAADPMERWTIARPTGFPAETPATARLWVDTTLTEVCLYWPGNLARYNTKNSTWKSIPFNEQTSALVRTAFRRFVIVEPRLR